MRQKASETRVLMRVPISFRDSLQRIARENKTNMTDEVMKLIPKEAGENAAKQNTPTTNLTKGDQISGIGTEKATLTGDANGE
jgi:hypothetical protein